MVPTVDDALDRPSGFGDEFEQRLGNMNLLTQGSGRHQHTLISDVHVMYPWV
jgi:hypothetical protein